MHGALNLLLLRGLEVNAGTFPPSQLFFDEEQPKVTCSRVRTVWRMGQNPDVVDVVVDVDVVVVLLLWAGHIDLGFVGFA